ncbi:MAG: multiple sugar transport system permease protein, partial [Fimbriimonadaceae bacterium]|nr:multiple sugar transport system permease protein [Fimbriimonadaceae bacterium]
MPFSAWLATFSVLFVVVSLIQAFIGFRDEERKRHLSASGAWAGAALIGFVLFKRDSDSAIHVLRGGVPFHPATAIALILLAIAAMALMAISSRAAGSRNLAKGVAAHLALVAGSIVFGIPLIYLLITSFKED